MPCGGEMWDKALTYCRQAGAKAFAKSAYREAVGFWEQALEALGHLPPDCTALEQAVDLRYDLSVALVPLGQWEQILTHMRAAETVAERLADQRRMGRVCRRIGTTLRQLQDYEPALVYCQRVHAIATALGDVGLQIWVNCDMSEIYYDWGDYRRAIACVQQMLTAPQGVPPDQSFGGAVRPAIQARVRMMQCLSELGAFADGVAYGDEAGQMAEVGGRPFERLVVDVPVGRLYVRQGTLHTAIPLLERAVALSQDADIPSYYHNAAPCLALAYALAGRAADALAVLRQLGGNMGSPPNPLNLLTCGEAYLLAGYVEEAHRLAERALAHAHERKMRGNEAWALWLLGEIAMHGNPPDAAPAEAHYQQALALTDELDMRPLMAHCHLGLGILYSRIGRREPACAELSTALTLLRSMGMTFWLPQAEAALATVH